MSRWSLGVPEMRQMAPGSPQHGHPVLGHRGLLFETVRKAISDGDVDFLREGLRVLAEAVMEAEVTEVTGVPHGATRP